MIFSKDVIAGKYNVIIKNLRDTQIRELKMFEMYLGDKLVGRVFYFGGRDYYKPWFEIDYHPWPREEGIEIELFRLFYESLEGGSKFFVTYNRDPITASLLERGYHPSETPLGKSLLLSGFTWFKDYYFAEGGNEGFQKLQANKPISKEAGKRELEEMLKEVRDIETRILIQRLIENET
ncbi:MAG: DUF1122 family protein [Sulfolobus sp.]|nr:DUF1122 family protein [Sulfolobus sp.]